MKSRDKDVKAAALERVRIAFKKFRDDGNGRGSGYPLQLKRLAIAAVDCGHTLTEVAAATHVSGPSLGNWRRASVCRAPTRLQMVEEPPSSQEGAVHRVSIYFQSGIRIELPMSEMTGSFLRSLNQMEREP